MDTAYFVKHPRIIADLQKPHLMSAERPYEIAAEATLSEMDYENFITDMLADRQFIEDAARLCSEGDPLRCLRVSCLSARGGVLVVPELDALVKWAALIP